MEKDRLPFGNVLDIVGQFLRKTVVEYFFRLFIPEPLDHKQIITVRDIIVKGYWYLWWEN